MANIKISDLAAASSAVGTHEYEVNESGTSKKVTGSQLSTFILGNITLSDVSDITATAAEVNLLDGVTATTAELNYVDGVTSSIQTQIDAKVSSTSPSITGTIIEDVYAWSSTSGSVSTELEPANGSIQTVTLTGNITSLTDNVASGEAITLMIDDGTAYTITWPTMTWVNNRGDAPTLATSGYTVVAIWKVSTTLYGALVGDGS